MKKQQRNLQPPPHRGICPTHIEKSAPPPREIKDKWDDGQGMTQNFTQNFVSKEALDVIKGFPVLEELGSEPTKKDLTKSIDTLVCGKALGEASI